MFIASPFDVLLAMFAVLHQSTGTVRDLGRLLACWLTVLLLLQGLAATLSLVAGPPHRHSAATLERLGDDHAMAHAKGHDHFHSVTDGAVVGEADMQVLDAGALQLLSLLIALPVSLAMAALIGQSARCALLQRAFASHVTQVERRPPRP